MSAEPTVSVPLPVHGGAPACPVCGYCCGCNCFDACQTPCPAPDEDGDCACGQSCHGGHEPWDCADFATRYDWALAKSKCLATEQEGENHE